MQYVKQHRSFKFSRAISDIDDPADVRVQNFSHVRPKYCATWKPLFPSHSAKQTIDLLIFCPDLSKIPSLGIFCAERLDEVAKPFVSTESRVNNS